GLAGAFAQYQVTANSGVDNVTANSGADNIVVFQSASSGGVAFQFKYLCSFISGGNTKVTYSDMTSGALKDWITFDSIGQSYTSTFTTGFMTRGDAQRKWQTNYVMVWCNPGIQSIFTVQGIDDYSKLSSTSVVNDLAETRPKRIKV